LTQKWPLCSLACKGHPPPSISYNRACCCRSALPRSTNRSCGSWRPWGSQGPGARQPCRGAASSTRRTARSRSPRLGVPSPPGRPTAARRIHDHRSRKLIVAHLPNAPAPLVAVAPVILDANGELPAALLGWWKSSPPCGVARQTPPSTKAMLSSHRRNASHIAISPPPRPRPPPQAPLLPAQRRPQMFASVASSGGVSSPRGKESGVSQRSACPASSTAWPP